MLNGFLINTFKNELLETCTVIRDLSFSTSFFFNWAAYQSLPVYSWQALWFRPIPKVFFCSPCSSLRPTWTVCVFLHCHHAVVSLPLFRPQTQFCFPLLLFLGPDCVSPSHSAPLSYHNHYPQNPPASPALLVHTECPRDYPLDDTIHQSVLHMPHHLGTAPLLLLIFEPQGPHSPSTL